MPAAIIAEGLVKRYGDVTALDGLDLEVAEGTVLGLLGPNGAGKTTTVRIFTTLLAADRGRASVAGYDVVTDAESVRRVIGLSGQYAAVDENLTGRENLEIFGRLYRLAAKAARARADELLERFRLTDAGGRPVKTYSGGMRRRLDLAGSLVGRPRLLFLDEPTTGLDPRSRLEMWDVIENLVRRGTTLLLTTQYLEEADQLADRIAVVDHGRVIAEGTSDELKARIGGDVVEVIIHDRARLDEAVDALVGCCHERPTVDRRARRLSVPSDGGAKVLVEVIRELDAVGIAVDDIALRRPTLDDVFLTLTGHATASAPESDDEDDVALEEVSTP
jgi:ABC-2 type transport system ATP-binding protein